MACSSLLGSGIFTITDPGSQSIGLCPGFFALRQKSTVLVRPRGVRQHDAAEWNSAATSVVLSLVSLANPQSKSSFARSYPPLPLHSPSLPASELDCLQITVHQITPEISSCGFLADFQTPLPPSSSTNSTALQTCIQRIASIEPDLAIRYAYNYALYTSAIAFGAELGMPRPVSLRGSGLDRDGRRRPMKNRIGTGRLG